MSQPDLQSRLDFALAAYAKARSLILNYYQQDGLEVERKRDSSPVTIADKGAEELLRAEIAKEFAGDGVLGEEFGDHPGTTGFRWVLDPVDGTKSFIHGVPLFGTLIGLEYQGECVAGVCRIPPLHEVVYAAKGQGAWWQIGSEPPRPARVSAIGDIRQATFCTTDLNGYQVVNQEAAYHRC